MVQNLVNRVSPAFQILLLVPQASCVYLCMWSLAEVGSHKRLNDVVYNTV